MNNEHVNYLLGVFDDEHKLIEAGKRLKDQNIKIFDIYTPFPVHGLDDLLEIKRSRLPYVTLFAGVLGCFAAFYFQYWVSSIDWPIIVGGKPHNSFMAFIPVAFEITVLFGALISVAAFFFRSKLCPTTKGNLPHIECTDDKFVLAVECINASINSEKLKSVLTESGAVEVEMKRGGQWM